MNIPRRHLILISIIIVLIAINYILFQKYIDNKFSKTFSFNIYNNGVLINEEKINEVINATNTPSYSATSSNSETQIKTTSKDKTSITSILHFGDAMFDRGVRKRMTQGVDLFSSLSSLGIMSDYEIRMLNLEGPIVEMDRSKCQQKIYNFQFATNTAKILKREGFNAVNIANNHIYDCYNTGIVSSQKYLSESNINIIGNIKPENNYKIITTNNGRKVVLVGVDITINTYPNESFFENLKKLKSENDSMIVDMHAGEEYLIRANDKQKELAHKLIDSGADAVIGHHPHVVENMELYNGGIIFYSLGNFIFDQEGEKENEGLGVGLKISSEDIDIMLFPYNIENSVPTFMGMQKANDWCARYFSVTPKVAGDGCSARIIRE